MPKYDITKTKKLRFARFGGLSSVNQKGYDPEPTSMHSPPCNRGFYAFVWPYYEMFLLGGYASIAWKPGSKFTYARDKTGKVIDINHPDHDKITEIENNGYWSITTKKFDECRKNFPEFDDPDYEAKSNAIDKDWEDNHKGEAKWVYVVKPSPRIFEFDGDLWHHLSGGLKQHQILKRHGEWVKSSTQDFRVALEKEMHAARVDEAKFAIKQGIMPSTKSPFRYYCKDHLEVFIEKL